MTKLIKVLCVLFFLMAPLTVHANNGATQSYTAIVPSMAITAEWMADFEAAYAAGDVYTAVATVFNAGRSPEDIVLAGMTIEDINPQGLVAALYCAGAKHDDIRLAAESQGLSGLIIVAGFETAKTVCGDAIADTQAYTPIGPAFSGVPGGSSGGSTYGSVSGFSN